MLRKTNPPCSNLTMLNFSCKKGYMKLCCLGNIVVLLVQIYHSRLIKKCGGIDKDIVHSDLDDLFTIVNDI